MIEREMRAGLRTTFRFFGEFSAVFVSPAQNIGPSKPHPRISAKIRSEESDIVQKLHLDYHLLDNLKVEVGGF